VLSGLAVQMRWELLVARSCLDYVLRDLPPWPVLLLERVYFLALESAVVRSLGTAIRSEQVDHLDFAVVVEAASVVPPVEAVPFPDASN
jgi:hypothetical protein